jgi:hypothetical protein
VTAIRLYILQKDFITLVECCFWSKRRSRAFDSTFSEVNDQLIGKHGKRFLLGGTINTGVT